MVSCHYLVFATFLLSTILPTAVIQPDIIIVNISKGERTILLILSKRKPVPNLYNPPLRSIISPIYMSNVIVDAIIAGINTHINLRLPRRKEQAKNPEVIPRSIKNTVIRKAETAETFILPVLQKAVKHARIQRPRNITEHTDCIINAFIRFLSPLTIICPNPYRQFSIERISTIEIM